MGFLWGNQLKWKLIPNLVKSSWTEQNGSDMNPYSDSTSFAINNVTDIEVTLLQVNLKSFGSCRSSQGKRYHDSSAAQYSAGTSWHNLPLLQLIEQQLMKFLPPNPDSSSKFNWRMAVPRGHGAAAPGPAERLRLCFCASVSTRDSMDTKDLQSLANLGSYLMSLHLAYPTLV